MGWSAMELSELALLRLSGFSFRKACEQFHRLHPDRPKPSHHLCYTAVERLLTTGSAQPKKRPGRTRMATTEYQAARLEAILAANPCTTMREASLKLGISVGSVATILSRKGYKYYFPHCGKRRDRG